jgi:hypothetical protein
MIAGREKFLTVKGGWQSKEYWKGKALNYGMQF